VIVYADLYTYRDLFFNLFRRDLQVRYRGSILGLFWTFLNPLVLVGVYTLVFSVLWRAFAIENYALFVCTGLVVWTFFSGVMTTASSSLVSQAQLVQQVRFPRQLLPLSVTAAGAVTLLVMLAVVLVLNLSFIPETRSTFWLALPMLVPLVAFTAALAIIAACLTVLFRDIEHLIQTVLLPWFFLTPIFYTFEALPGVEGHPNVVKILYWGNPITPGLEAVRDPLFFGTLTRPSDAIYSVVAAVVALTVASVVFRRVDDQLAAQL
jgi:ABC-type polysaccharide/polyol phosphate export permease